MQYNIITTVNKPTEAVVALSKFSNSKLIVVGDLKTPNNWECKNVKYLAVDCAEIKDYKLNKVLPYNHYARKNLGYVYAIRQSADFIYDTDDDNIPLNEYFFPETKGAFATIAKDKCFFNIYQYFLDDYSFPVWPRGFPLDKIREIENFQDIEKCEISVGVWQGLADEDPDVDAIYRLTSNKPVYFKYKEPIVLKRNTYSPYNSQNTFHQKNVFPLLYLPSTVTFRFTDILRGIISQAIMWLYDLHLGFVHATVVQKRNEHNFLVDFLSEIPMYCGTAQVLTIVEQTISKNSSMSTNIFNVYKELSKEKIVTETELFILEAWLYDIDNC